VRAEDFSEILSIIEIVESYLKRDMGDSLNRCRLSNILDYAPQEGLEDKELSEWLDKMSYKLLLLNIQAIQLFL